MGELKQPEPVLRLLAIFSRYPEALDWVERRVRAEWGPVDLASPRFVFHETEYYRATMGDGLLKMFLAVGLADPVALPAWKLQTNTWERQCADQGNWPESRPVNIDPGYISQGKLVLASTKDHAHRIYLSEGIYAEITLRYTRKCWQSQPWTYPDYQRDDFQDFFDTCRAHLRSRLRGS